MEKPTIVIVAYNRITSLKRLLDSISRAKYPPNVKLIISIDLGGNPDVIALANDFNWEYGQKEVLIQKEHLGLRNHIIKCGDLTLEYESIVLLEDDLLVSPMFYEYATKALNYYHDDENIAGISLYSQFINFFIGFPFIPIIDEYDVYFLQIPASWGEAWTKNQWSEFKRWYSLNKNNLKPLEGVPKAVFEWPHSSWAKFFWTFMVINKKYFVYPRFSLTTQFGEIGEHSPQKSLIYQVPLQLFKSEYKFAKLKDSKAVYDSFFEILPKILNKLTTQLEDYDSVTVDLHGSKEFDKMKTKFVLTSKNCKNYLCSYGQELKPIEMNIIEGIKGKQLFLCHKDSIRDNWFSKLIRKQKNYVYYFRNLTKKKLLILLFFKALRKI